MCLPLSWRNTCFAIIAAFGVTIGVVRGEEPGKPAPAPVKNSEGKAPQVAPAQVAPPQVPPPAAAPLELPLDGREGRELLLRNFRPKPALRVEEHLLTRAKFPMVDIHTHFGLRFRHSKEQLEAFVEVMDRTNIAVCISLDGKLGESFSEHVKYLSPYADRFAVFAYVDWQGSGKKEDPASWDCHRPEFGRHIAELLAEAKRQGACGVKIFKDLGLTIRNPDGSRTTIDDPRWDPIWKACGELGLPVLIHSGDPSAFFLPIDETNERWEELSRRPEWSFHGAGFPKRDDLHAERLRAIGRHRRTTFIAAHLANDGEDLKTLGKWLDEHPNLHVDIASRIGELGRQPYTAREFFLQYADRIVMGTDGPWPEERLRSYFRFLETFDENFPYSEKPFPPQGLWNIHGIGLPDDVLKKIYSENAQRLVPGLREKVARFAAKP